MANCANCEQELPEGKRGFCADCSARFAEMPGVGATSGQGGLGSVLGRITGALGGRVVSIGIVLAISAVTGGLCFNSQGDPIDDQNRAAEGLSTDNAGDRTGRKNIFDLRVGDCVAEFGAEAEGQDSALLVACSDMRARTRVVKLVLVQDLSEFSSEAYFETQAGLFCGIEARHSSSPAKKPGSSVIASSPV